MSKKLNNTMSTDMRDALAHHVINLNEGRFSDEGEFTTSVDSVNKIFSVQLPNAHKQARLEGKPLRVVFYAHGGLTAEREGLQIAYNQLAWWKANDIYPVFFVWETGLLETISQLLNSNIKGRSTRDIADYTIDPIVERLCRSLGAVKIWSGMKFSASEAHQENSGGWYVANQLSTFLAKHPDTELHAVGHSAGSIFHSHFVPCCLDLGVPEFDSLQFLAPAISVPVFHQRLLSKVGNGIKFTTIYTMKKVLERNDSTAKIYRKSLLYLVSRALESKKNTPVLGLEESIQNDKYLKSLFGLTGKKSQSDKGEIIWSKTDVDSGSSASKATTHGGFDNDPVTMNSVVRRILGLAEMDEIAGFPEDAEVFASRAIKRAHTGVRSFDDDDEFDLVFKSKTESDESIALIPEQEESMNKRALCIGINEYPNPRHVLYGCVADANTWAAMFKRLGFAKVDLLLDADATREAILSAIKNLIATTKSGDTIVIQYSGHGTQVRDYDFDESMEGVNPGQNDGKDEALCPVDFESGNLLIDDDLRNIFQNIPDGANVTGFYDCCHSATISRGIGGLNLLSEPDGDDVRPRTVVISREVESKHKSLRESLNQNANDATANEMPNFKEVTFSACKASEVALERDGQGDFTRNAMQVLNQGINGMSNAEFLDKVIEAFGRGRKQNPNMDSSEAAMTKLFLV